MKLRVLDLFSGIGGFSLGLERTGGFETVAFCETNLFCVDVLNRHWPNVPVYGDVRELTANSLFLDGITVDVICGGFPCQDISSAGKRAGLEAERSGLWFEYLRLIGELRPRYAIVENVTDLLRGPSDEPGEWAGTVFGGLAQIRYDAVWDCIPASAVRAPHIRDRVWIIAQPQHSDADSERCNPGSTRDARPIELRHEQGGDTATVRAALPDTDVSGLTRARSAQSARRQRGPVASGRSEEMADANSKAGRSISRRTKRRDGGEALREGPAQSGRCSSDLADANGEPMERPAIAWEERDTWEAEPDFCRVVDGLPDGLDHERAAAVGALGNSVVWPIPFLLGNAILSVHGLKAPQSEKEGSHG